jgi:WD40 repeat protein
VAFGPDGQLAAVSADFTIEIRQIEETGSGRKICTLPGHDWTIREVVFSPDARFSRLASVSADGTMRIWDVTAGRKLIEFPRADDVYAVAFSREGRRLVSGGWDRVVKVWDAHTGQLLEDVSDPTGGVRSVAFHPKDDRVLVWGSSDSTIKMWNGMTKEIRTLHGHTSWVESVAFSPDGEWIASGILDGTIKLWQVPLTDNERL